MSTSIENCKVPPPKSITTMLRKTSRHLRGMLLLSVRGNSAGSNQWNIALAIWSANGSQISFDRYCNGTVHEVTTGWIDPAGSGRISLYRCYTGADYFVSPDINCEGYKTEYLLGYGLPPRLQHPLTAAVYGLR